jgi:oligogalacturonide transport system permease protein
VTDTHVNRGAKPGRIHALTRRDAMGMVYISPWIIGFLVFGLYPFLASIFYSFTDFNMMRAPRFVGFRNYAAMFTTDVDFYKSLGITLIYSFAGVPLRLACALGVALLLNMKLRTVNFFRTVYYIPSMLGGSVAVAIVWRSLFASDGSINVLLGLLGLSPVKWLGSPALALGIIILLNVWQFGSSMLIFLAGLQQIPQELYNSAAVDGANRTRVFFRITLPLITPVIFFNLIMQMINALQEFSAPFLITRGLGDPMKSTYFYGMLLYDNAFRYSKMGYACALSWLQFAIILALTAFIFRSSKGWVYYEDGGK